MTVEEKANAVKVGGLLPLTVEDAEPLFIRMLFGPWDRESREPCQA